MSATEHDSKPKASTDPVDAHIDTVLINQLVWKNPTVAALAVRVCNAALQHGTFWPDEVSLAGVLMDDRNCVGSVYRLLAGRRLEIVERTTQFRRSTAEGRNGSTVFAYALKNRKLAESLVKRLGGEPKNPQLQLL